MSTANRLKVFTKAYDIVLSDLLGATLATTVHFYFFELVSQNQ